MVNIVKAVETEKDEFVSGNSPGCCYENETMDISNDFELVPVQNTQLKVHKEVQTSSGQVKMFRTIGTQTEDVLAQRKPSTRNTDDINKILHLQDHSYSLGPKNQSSTDDHFEVAKSCLTPSTPDLNENSIIGGNQHELVIMESGDEAFLVESDNDDCLSDSCSLYCPSASDDSETDDESLNGTTPSTEKKFIVFESQLLKLFQLCQNCGSPIDTTTQHRQGSMVTIAASCINGHTFSWQSQPIISGSAAGNLLIPASILFSGNTYKHIADFAKYLNLEFIQSSHYYSTQTTILFPVVNHTYIEMQTAVLKQMKQNGSVDVCGDGRCDSPGHSAKYGTYTLLDEKTNLIIEFSRVQVTEVTSSNAMEYEGCKRTLNSMIKKKIPIRCLTTDRHTTITAKMRSNYPKITHQYDVWHISKWITKKLTKKAKKKGCEELLPWIRSVSNHLWWSAATCDENADILREKWLSVLYHITGKHRWKTSEDFKNVKKCGHPSISRKDQKSIKWLEAGSPAHIALEEVVTNNKLLKDICKLTEFHHTGQLESYHSLMTKYVPKREHFCYNGMVARTQLAILDHNNNVNRSQAEVKQGANKGEKRFKLVCSKQRKNWVAKEIKTPKSTAYVEGLMEHVMQCKKGKKLKKYKPPKQAKCIAPTPKPSKQEVINDKRNCN